MPAQVAQLAQQPFDCGGAGMPAAVADALAAGGYAAAVAGGDASMLLPSLPGAEHGVLHGACPLARVSPRAARTVLLPSPPGVEVGGLRSACLYQESCTFAAVTWCLRFLWLLNGSLLLLLARGQCAFHDLLSAFWTI